MKWGVWLVVMILSLVGGGCRGGGDGRGREVSAGPPREAGAVREAVVERDAHAPIGQLGEYGGDEVALDLLARVGEATPRELVAMTAGAILATSQQSFFPDEAERPFDVVWGGVDWRPREGVLRIHAVGDQPAAKLRWRREGVEQVVIVEAAQLTAMDDQRVKLDLTGAMAAPRELKELFGPGSFVLTVTVEAERGWFSFDMRSSQFEAKGTGEVQLNEAGVRLYGEDGE